MPRVIRKLAIGIASHEQEIDFGRLEAERVRAAAPMR
jgi:hypothetical protein